MLAAFILNNGWMYHMAHSLALMEYLLALHFRPSLKSFPYISFIGKSYGLFSNFLCYVCGFAGIIAVFLGQFMRSAAMIKAASNFSHAVAFRKRAGHQLVTDGVYALVTSFHPSSFRSQFDMQMVKTPVLRWLLLLGVRDAAGSAESSVFLCLLGATNAILFLANQR